MKNTLVGLASLLFSFNADAQPIPGTLVPSIVKSSFNNKFPESNAKKWIKEGSDYEAEFVWKKIESSAVFDSNGIFKEMEQELSKTLLPISVVDYCKKNYPNYKLTEAAQIIDANGIITFEAEMSKGKEHFDALFQANGLFLKKVISEEKGKTN